jgi:hypothetical protein
MMIKHVKGMSTHNVLLIKAVLLSDGPVLEIGSGFFSTPLLHWLCKMTGKDLVTYENNLEYFEMARKFKSRHHSIRLIGDWSEMDSQTQWGVVFVDHSPKERRIVDIEKYKDKAEYLVIHDTERADLYSYDKVWPMFKYRYEWQECVPYTTVVSNVKDLSNFKEYLCKK